MWRLTWTESKNAPWFWRCFKLVTSWFCPTPYTTVLARWVFICWSPSHGGGIERTGLVDAVGGGQAGTIVMLEWDHESLGRYCRYFGSSEWGGLCSMHRSLATDSVERPLVRLPWRSSKNGNSRIASFQPRRPKYPPSETLDACEEDGVNRSNPTKTGIESICEQTRVLSFHIRPPALWWWPSKGVPPT